MRWVKDEDDDVLEWHSPAMVCSKTSIAILAPRIAVVRGRTMAPPSVSKLWSKPSLLSAHLLLSTYFLLSAYVLAVHCYKRMRLTSFYGKILISIKIKTATWNCTLFDSKFGLLGNCKGTAQLLNLQSFEHILSSYSNAGHLIWEVPPWRVGILQFNLSDHCYCNIDCRM